MSGRRSERGDGARERRVLEGTIDVVTHHNHEDGYTIAKLVPDGGAQRVTVVGRLVGVTVGASYRLEGRWTTHARYGRQFSFDEHRERLPATAEGLRRYLGSGLIEGVGPKTADRIVAHFGLDALEIIDESPERLVDVPGVGPVRARSIAAAWEEQRHVKEIMLFLQSHEVSTALAVRIYKTYGDDAIGIVRADPYRLAREVWGVGFLTADRIARSMGLAPDGPRRIEAGLLFALDELANEGHTLSPHAELAAKALELLAVDEVAIAPEAIAAGIERLVAAEALVAERLEGPDAEELRGPQAQDEAADEPVVTLALPPFHYAEVGIAAGLRRLLAAPTSRMPALSDEEAAAALRWLDGTSPYPLAAQQREAVRTALRATVSVLTGGPGTGKTTTVRSLLQLLEARAGSPRILLAAPTGRAAKRLAETTGRTAKTLHRLLEFKPGDGRLFQRHEERPLEADVLVVDEMSMVDTILMSHLVKAIGPGTRVLFVGDVDQLPSVGAGNVLRDLIDSGVLPTVELDEIFRQDEHSFIALNAQRINRGERPILDREASDFFLFRAEEAEAAADWVVDVVSQRVPRRFGLDPLRDIQVLTPMHRGAAGVAALNERLQAALNPPGPARPEVRWAGRTYRLGDKLMQVRNDYDKDVFNGDVGRLVALDPAEREATLRFGDQDVPYAFHELDELVHAFATSIHKSQGSEYPCVVVALVPAHWMMLQRNLLYTAVTRARRLCVLVGSQRAIDRAVQNDRVAARHTALARRLRGAGG